jgi:hypothetical protein
MVGFQPGERWPSIRPNSCGKSEAGEKDHPSGPISSGKKIGLYEGHAWLPDNGQLSRKQTRKSFVFWQHLQPPVSHCSEVILSMQTMRPSAVLRPRACPVSPT